MKLFVFGSVLFPELSGPSRICSNFVNFRETYRIEKYELVIHHPKALSDLAVLEIELGLKRHYFISIVDFYFKLRVRFVLSGRSNQKFVVVVVDRNYVVRL